MPAEAGTVNPPPTQIANHHAIFPSVIPAKAEQVVTQVRLHQTLQRYAASLLLGKFRPLLDGR